VTLSLGREQHAIYVRAYADDIAPGTTTERESQLILAYVARQIESGWRPSGQKGESGRLVYAPAPAGTDAAPPDKPGSWWRFTSGRDNPPRERTGE
jgi:hypothetical protein